MNTTETGDIMCCGQIVTWEDCAEHDECYHFYCQKCGQQSPTDCHECIHDWSWEDPTHEEIMLCNNCGLKQR